MVVHESLFKFAEGCVQQFRDYTSSVAGVYRTKISHEVEVGSGVVIKIEDGPLNTGKRASTDESAVRFMVSDGEYAIDCMAHNGSLSTMPEGVDSNTLTDILMTLTESMRSGFQVRISGHFQIHNRDKVFVVRNVWPLKDNKRSQLSSNQVEDFVTLCQTRGTDPLNVMIDDTSLWRHVYAHVPIKMAVMLNCLSPFKKQDMIHMAVITSMGEGKDHLIENVMQPLVPCGVASTGKLCTIPGLFGAMSGDDLNSIELGLIGKMNNERIAVSEFQTWGSDVFGELMNMLANGYYTMQKGQVDVHREAILNMSFWGNPDKDYKHKDEGGHSKKLEMMDVFKDYTYQMISRMTLMFTQMSLTDAGAEEYVENKILDAMSGTLDTPEAKYRLSIWRQFFREYLRYVSRIEPDLQFAKKYIRDVFNKDIKNAPLTSEQVTAGRKKNNFQTIFLKRSQKENRKFQQYINLCKGIARLQGDTEVTRDHLSIATGLFAHSLKTLIENLVPMNTDILNAPYDIRRLFADLNYYSEGGQYPDELTLKKVLKENGISMTDKQLNRLYEEGFLQKGLIDGEPTILLDEEALN